jgi:hypothetical protein
MLAAKPLPWLAQDEKPKRTGCEARSRRRLGQKEMAMTGKNRIMIYGPKDDGTYVIEFRTAAGEARAISIPRTQTAVIRPLPKRMPYRLFV